jgi:NADH-quinone oxidoreductase subunit K
METIPVEHAMIIATILFTLGLIGVLIRRNILFVLMSIEVMLNATALAFIVAGAKWGQADGQILFILTIAMAAAEVAIGLALALLLNRTLNTLDSDAANTMQG